MRDTGNKAKQSEPSSGSYGCRFPLTGYAGRADTAETVNSGHVQPETLKRPFHGRALLGPLWCVSAAYEETASENSGCERLRKKSKNNNNNKKMATHMNLYI